MQTVAVPESITREAYVSLVAAAGFETDGLTKLEFRKDGIYAEVYAKDPETGKLLLDELANEVVVNRVWIPVKD